MSKSTLLDELSFLSNKLTFIQAIGLASIIFYLHILGLREGLAPVGFVFNNPINAGYVFTDIILAFAWAYFFEAAVRAAVVGFREFSNIAVAKWKGKEPAIIIAGMSDLEYAYDAWKTRIILTVIFYAWSIWLLCAVIWFGLFSGRYLFSKFRKSREVRDNNNYGNLNDDEYQRLMTYWNRTLVGLYIVLACIFAYITGALRIEHIKLEQSTIAAYWQGTEYKGQVIYSLSESYVLYDPERGRYSVLPHSNTVIQQLYSETPPSTGTEDTHFSESGLPPLAPL